MRTVLLVFIAVIAPLAAFCILGEVFFRIWVPEVLIRRWEAAMYYGMMEVDENLGRVLKAGYNGRILANGIDFDISTNSKRLRDREFSYQKTPGTLRVLAIGDSFTFGYGVQQGEAWPKRLEKYLIERLGRKNIEVINAGVSGWGTYNQREFLLREGVKYDPDIVLLGFYWNDLVDNQAGGVIKQGVSNWRAQRENVEKFLRDKPLLRLLDWMGNNSYLYVFFEDRVGVLKEMVRAQYFRATGRASVGGIVSPDYEAGGLPETGISLVDMSKNLETDLLIDEWEVFTTSRSNVRLLVWRPNVSSNGYSLVGSSNIQTIEEGSYNFKIDPPIETRAGDYLGLYMDGGEIPRNLPHRGTKLYLVGERQFISAKAPEDRYSGYSFGAYGKIAKRGGALDGPTGVDRVELDNSKPVVTNERYSVFLDPPSEKLEASWQQTFKLIREMAAVTKEKGIQFYVVYMPFFEEVWKRREGTTLQPSPEVLEKEFDMDLSLPRDRLSTQLSLDGISFINPTERVRNSDVDVLYVIDSHFNALGHDIVAKDVSIALTEREDLGKTNGR